MKLAYKIQDSNNYLLVYALQEYRKRFLKRKNVSNYKKNRGNVLIDKLLNAFDRKIKGIDIFTIDVKTEYFKGLKNIYNEFYNSTYENRPSKNDERINKLAEEYIKNNPNY